MSPLLNLTIDQLMVWFGSVWWPFVRLSAFLWAMPLFDNPAVTPRSRILLALAMSGFRTSREVSIPMLCWPDFWWSATRTALF